MSELLRRIVACTALALAGCTPERSLPPPEDLLYPAPTLVDNRPDAEGAHVRYLHGRFGANCEGRTGTWTVALDGSPSPTPLSLLRGDEDCELIITSAETSDGRQLPPQGMATLGDDFSEQPVPFGDPPEFYASGKLDAEALEGSGEVVFVIAENVPELVSYSATVQGAAVPAPDYSVDLRGLIVETDVHHVVRELRGSATLRAHSVRGDAYAIATGRLTTYAALDAAYLSENRPFTEEIPARELKLLEVDLSTHPVRTLIIAHVEQGVRAYQAAVIQFDPPP